MSPSPRPVPWYEKLRFNLPGVCMICTATIAAHGWLNQQNASRIDAAVTHAVQKELEPLRLDLQRAHARIDQLDILLAKGVR